MGGGLSIPEAGDRLSRTCSFDDSVRRLRYVSGSRGDALERLGILRVRDLMLHVPRRYLDFTHTVKIGLCEVGSTVTVVGTVDKVSQRQPRPRMNIVTVDIFDDTGALTATFFRQPWLYQQLHKGDTIALSGEVLFYKGFRQMKAPFIEQLEGSQDGSGYARILPVHPVGEGITASWMRRIVSAAIADAGDACDFLPADLVARHGFMSLGRALREIHYPATLDGARSARRRLAYDELLCLQLALLTRQRIDLGDRVPKRHTVAGTHVEALRRALPFSLTDEQEAAVIDILSDMAAPRVMNRLLLGDVGTGKTAVAAVALAAVADSGMQAAVMAPTSVLARQYAEKVGPLLDAADIRWVLITGSTPARERAEAAESIAAGQIDAVFGTTAILSDDISFRELSLVVIDEQHRFGVEQRSKLWTKSAQPPHVLVMTATPIPRTLAMTLYGDLECSIIDELPPGRKAVKTIHSTDHQRLKVFGFIRNEIAKGRQVYIVYPLIEESETMDLKDLMDGYESIVREFPLPQYQISIVHGRMDSEAKDYEMGRFKRGETQIMVSTTVIEVGVDVPNASVMIIENAERFGLSQLHQLRGRVGRGAEQSYCILMTGDKLSNTARERIKIMVDSNDGFRIAEADLRLRGPGDLQGLQQSGILQLKLADIVSDEPIVRAARETVQEILEKDPQLQSADNACLRLYLQKNKRALAWGKIS